MGCIKYLLKHEIHNMYHNLSGGLIRNSKIIISKVKKIKIYSQITKKKSGICNCIQNYILYLALAFTSTYLLITLLSLIPQS